ncbi:MAG: hypothetical protein LBC31_07970 [Treponema sp.]|jgi:hypothetical protein|nr:hypothetical protein [Treponema sp.]
MREELELHFDAAAELFDEIYALIEQYVSYHTKKKDTYLKNKFKELIGEDISEFLDEHIEKYYDPHEDLLSDHIRGLTMRFCWKRPNPVNDITKEELTEIVKRIINCHTERYRKGLLNGRKIGEWLYAEYYEELLKMSFENYKPEYFSFKTDERENWFDPAHVHFKYTSKQIAEKIWNKQ